MRVAVAWVAVAILAVLVMGEDDVTSLDSASEDPEYMLTFEGNHGDQSLTPAAGLTKFVQSQRRQRVYD